MEKQEEYNQNAPVLLHQTAHLDIFLNRQTIEATTTLWVAYHESVRAGDLLRLHCRQCVISEITVNGLPCEWELRDGLQNVLPGKRRELQGAVLDGFYRLALDVAREGELQISMPSLLHSQWTPPAPLPSHVTSKEVLTRQRRLRVLYEQLVQQSVTRVPGGRYDVEDEEVLEEEQGLQSTDKAPDSNKTAAKPGPERDCFLVQVCVRYQVPMSAEHTLHCRGGGVVIRREPLIAKRFDKHTHDKPLHNTRQERDSAGNHSSERDKEREKENNGACVCVYTSTASGATLSLRDYDGVRCWLPTIDLLDQRASFDISLRCRNALAVACAGTKVSETTYTTAPPSGHYHGENAPSRVTHRFFVAQRVPAAQLGFFVGRAERYALSLSEDTHSQTHAHGGSNAHAQTHARSAHKDSASGVSASVWVATGLADFRSAPTHTHTQTHTAEKREKSVVAAAAQPPHTTAGESTNVNTSSVVPEPEEDETHAQKRMRTGDSTSNASSLTTAAQDTHAVRTSKRDKVQGSSAAPPHTSRSAYAPVYRRLYEHRVHHTMLGFDLAYRLLQKFTGHRYTHRRLTIVFVHELGADFVPYEGLILVDSKFLHDNRQVYLESPANLTLTLAFTYSWLRGSLALSSYEDEYLLHGLAHYLLSLYVEEVFGPCAGQYFLQTKTDTVLSLEKMGRGFPLCAGPHTLSHSHAHSQTHSQAQATSAWAQGVVWERYETFLPWYAEYMQAKACVLMLWLETRVGGKDALRLALREILKGPLLFKPQVFLDQDPNHLNSGQSSPIHPRSPNHYSSQTSPNREGIVNESSPVSALSPSPLPYGGDVSPYRAAGSYTPYRAGLSPWVDRGTTSPASSSAAGQGRDEGYSVHNLPLREETLTAATFLLIAQRASDAPTDLDERFLEQFVSRSGLLFLKVALGVSEKNAGKPRNLRFITEQVGLRQGSGEIDRCMCVDGAVGTILIEDRDDNLSTPSLHFSAHRRELEQPEFVRPGRTSKKIADFPVKCLFVDPFMNFIGETRLFVREVALVGQLVYDYASKALERRRLPFQYQAIRALALSTEKPQSLAHTHTDAHTLSQASSQSSQNPQSFAAMLTAQKEGRTVTQPPTQTQAPTQAQGQAATQTQAQSSQSTQPTHTHTHRTYPNAVHRLFECVMGCVRQSESVSATFSLYVRAEAARALAVWQCEHAPSTVCVAPQSNESGWHGMHALCEAITELYIDTQTHTPLPLDLSDESALYLRCALLCALSECRARDGHTPWEVSEMLLLFAEDLLCEDEENGPKTQPFDTSHYTAVLLLALSRLRFIDMHLFPDNNPQSLAAAQSHPLTRIVRLAQDVIENEFTAARSRARIALSAGDNNALPSLSGNGVHVAAALTCLSEIDIQVTKFVTLKFEDKYRMYARFIEDLFVMPVSIHTRTKYTDFFLPPNKPLFTVYTPKSSHSQANPQGISAYESIRQDLDFFLCNSVVRAAAYEAFTRLAFATHMAHIERAQHRVELHRRRSSLKQQGLETKEDACTAADAAAAQGEDEVRLMASALEALETLCKRDSSVWVVQQCALALYDAVLDGPPRVVHAALSHNHSFFSLTAYDGAGFAIPGHLPHFVSRDSNTSTHSSSEFHLAFHHNPRVAALKRHNQKYIKSVLSTINSTAIRMGAYNQPLRAVLIHLLRHICGDSSTPSAFCTIENGVRIPPPSSYRDTLLQALQSAHTHHSGPLTLESPGGVVSNPFVSWLKFDEALKQRGGDKSNGAARAESVSRKSVGRPMVAGTKSVKIV